LAADQGNASAQHLLGLMYAQGKGVSQNYWEAAKWYRKAVEQGYTEAQNSLERSLILQK
jgi:TPR repeat protein